LPGRRRIRRRSAAPAGSGWLIVLGVIALLAVFRPPRLNSNRSRVIKHRKGFRAPGTHTPR
jgi:hypothetical protein